MKKRSPNIANTLLKNSISALFCAIEIHNKPKIEYRYPNVVVILLNAWELALKSYIYKFQKNKKIIEIDKKNGRYPGLEKCINLVFIGDDNLLYKSSIDELSKYRNKIVHAFSSDLDEIMYSVIYQNIILFGKFLKDFLKEDISTYDETLILLPIGFKQPFSPVDFLSDDSHLSDASNDVKDFIGGLINTTEKLYSKGINDSLFISYDIELLGKNKSKNADILVGIDKNSKYKIQKETKLRLSSERGVQAVVNYTIEEIKEKFKVNYKGISKLFKVRYSDFTGWNDKARKIYREEINLLEKRGIYWEFDFSDSNKKLFSKELIEEIFDKYYTKK